MQIKNATPPLKATLAVTIKQFRPLGGVFPISYSMGIIEASPGITVNDANIIIPGEQPTVITFKLTTPGFVFVGASFDADVDGTDVGSDEFPSITIDRSAAGSSLTINDANLAQDVGVAYSYILLVQNASSGEIGIIDPMIIAEPRGP